MNRCADVEASFPRFRSMIWYVHWARYKRKKQPDRIYPSGAWKRGGSKVQGRFLAVTLCNGRRHGEASNHAARTRRGGAQTGGAARTPAGGWAGFTRFKSVPNINTKEPNLRFVDVTGDGHPDILISEDTVFTWYESLAKDGFAPPRRAPKS